MTLRSLRRFVLALALSTASLAAAETTWLPGAAEVTGLAGARFTTTLEVANPGATASTLTIGLVPMEGAAAPAPVARTLAAGESLRVREALKTLFGLAEAAGTITVTSDAPLVSSLTTQNVAAPEGAYGLGLLPVAQGDLLGAGETGHAIWVSQSADASTGYRTNLSVTLAEAGTVVEVRVLDAEGRVAGTATVTAGSPFVWQRSVKALAGDADLPVARAEFEVKAGRATAFAVVNDNVTSDAIALQAERVVPGALDRLVSGAALSPGLLGAYWVTDLRLFNPGSAAVTATIRSVGAPSAASATVTVPAKGVVEVPRVLERLGFPERTASALRVTAAEPLLVAARTNNVDPAGVRKGTFSAQQFVTAWPAGLLSAGATGFFPGVDQTLNVPGVRTNLTLVGGPEGAKGELVLRDAAGAEQARTPFSRGAGEWGQLSVADWFGAAAAANGALAAATIPENARIDVAVFTGALDAFVSRIDNGSGDAVTRPFALPGGGDCSKVEVTAFGAAPQPILVGAQTTFSWSLAIDPPTAELTSQSIRFDGESEVELDKNARTYSRSFGAAGSRSATLTVRKGSCVKTRALTFFVCGELSVEPVVLPNGIAWAAYSARTLSLPGATAPVAWAVTSGALPQGLALSAAGEVSGTPTEIGTFTFSVRGTDANGCVGTRSYTMSVLCPSLRISPSTLPSGTVGVPWGTVRMTVSGGSGFGSWSATNLPPGLDLTPGGVLSGTPTTAGSYAVTIRYADDGGCVGTATYTILVCNTLVVGPPSLAPATLAQPYGPVVFTATGAVGATTWAVTAGTLPPGLTLASATGTLSGNPSATGDYAFTVTATDANGCTGSAAATLRVQQAPVFTSANGVTFTVGTAGSFTVTTTAFPVAALTSSGALPTGVTFVDNGNGTATLSGTPAAATGGTYGLTFTASNGVAPNGTQAFTLTVNQAPAITSAAAVTFTVGTPGTFTVTTTGFPAPSIARGGVALPSGVTFTDNGNGTGTLSGTPAAATGGTYAISFTAANVVGSTPAQAFTLTVNEAPAITSAAAVTFTVGTAGSFTVAATGFPAPSIARGGVSLPSGVTFVDNGDGTGTLSGTPAAATGGTYAITFTATNFVGSTPAQAFTLTVNQAPVITSGNAVTFTVGTPGTFTVTTTGFPAPSIARGGVALPSGVTFTDNGDGTGTLSGTPAAATGGTYAITFMATNVVGSTPAQAFTLTVNEAPSITSAAAVTFTVGTPGSFTVTTTGFPAPSIARGGVVLPSGVTFTDNGNGTGTLAGTPAGGTGGTYAITFTAANAAGSTPAQAFTLTVNQAPAITSGTAATFPIGTPGSFTVTTTGFPAPSIARGGVALPSGVTFTDNGDGTGTLAGTPAAATGGTYAITFTATNAAGTTPAQAFTLTVNQAPSITSGNAATFTVGTPGSFTVTTTGFPVPSIARGGVALPSGVTFTDNGDGTGTLAGTPAAGTGGTYAITFTATNTAGSTPAQAFTLTVNQAPSITSGTAATFPIGTPGTFTVTTTGFPAPSVARGGVALPSGVTFTDNGDGTGTLAGTPAAGTGGTYAITFTATNAAGSTPAQAFTLTVNQPPSITSGTAATFTVGTAGSFTVTTIGFPTPALGETGGLPTGVTFTDNGNGTATLAGTPAAGTGGTYPLTITAANGVLPNATQAFTLTVNQPPAITSANATNATIGVALAFTVTTTGSPTAATITVTGTLPTGVTFTNNGNGTATLGGTPAAGTQGAYALTITASNGVPPNATQAFTLTVVNRLPVLTTDPISYQTAGNTQLHVAGASLAGVVSISDAASALTKSAAADPDGDAIAVVAAAGATTNGGQYAIAANGSFTYVPAAGFSGSDSFTYQVSDGIGATVGTVNVTVGQRVWYVRDVVDANNPAGGDGRSTNAFQTLSDAQVPSLVGDVIFVFRGNTGVTPLSTSISLKAAQKLWGEGVGLAVPPFGTLVAAGLQPRVVTAGDTVTVAATSGSLADVQVYGLDLTSTGGNAVDVTTTGANLAGVTIGRNTFSGSGAEAVDVNQGGSIPSTVYIHTNVFNASTGNAIDARTTAGTLNLDVSLNTITSSANGIHVDGSGGGTLNVNGLLSNTVSGNTIGTGIRIASATFGPGAIPGGATAVGASGNGVGAAAISLTNVQGTLSFTDLDLFADGGAGLAASGTGSGLNLSVTSGVSVISATAGPAVDVTSATVDLQLQQLTSTNSASTGVNLNAVAGTFSAPAGSTITNAGTTDFVVQAGNATVTWGGTITDDVGVLVAVSSTTGGAKSFTGAISDGNDGDGSGVVLTNNTGATIAFSGGLTLSTGGNPAFTATGGGTVTVTGTTNTLTTTTGTALNVASTTIGAAGLTFRSISANGAANGIVLNATGSLGGLTVTGNGNTTKGGDSSGGTIQNTTGSGILLTNTRNVSLTNVLLSSTGSHGVEGTGLADASGGAAPSFAFRYGRLTSPGDADNENAFSFATAAATNATGRILIDNTVVTDFEENGVYVTNVSGSLTLDVTNSDFSDNDDVHGQQGVIADAAGTATLVANVTGNAFDNVESLAVDLRVSAQTATLDANVTNNTSTNGGGPDDFPAGGGILLNVDEGGTLTFDVNNNTLTNAIEGIVIVGEGNVQGRVQGNNVSIQGLSGGPLGGDGLRIDDDGEVGAFSGATTWNVHVSGNTFALNGVGDDGIQVLNRDHGGTLNLTIEGNTISGTTSEGIRTFDADRAGAVTPGPFAAYRIANNTFTNIGVPETVYVVSDDQASVCTNITGNSGNGTAAGKSFVLERRVAGATLQIAQASTAALQAANGGVVTVSVPIQPVTFNGGCVNPPLPTNP